MLIMQQIFRALRCNEQLHCYRLLIAAKRTNTSRTVGTQKTTSAVENLANSCENTNFGENKDEVRGGASLQCVGGGTTETNGNSSGGGGGTNKRSQDIQKFYAQQLHYFHSSVKHKQQAAQQPTIMSTSSEQDANDSKTAASRIDEQAAPAAPPTPPPVKEPSQQSGPNEILQFMELIGNLKHTKRTGWVLRDVNDCESISGHMYRMSILTFLLDGSEGLNQIRCMELALVHDLAESLVGDITPFCGVSKEQKRAMEFKAMEDICKLIEPRGKRIMALFEEYEHGASAESKFVKDLDRLDMVMQAFEYEKRDNCLLKHQEFFDSTEGKFQHPFVKQLVSAIYEQRRQLAQARGATPPPPVHVPDMDAPSSSGNSNGHQNTTPTKTPPADCSLPTSTGNTANLS